MSDESTLDQDGIVEIVDGDIPEIVPERQRCDGAVGGSDCPARPVEEIREWGNFCGKHYDETMQKVWAAAEHFDIEHAAAIPDDVVAAYKVKFPEAAEAEARQLASMKTRLKLFNNPYYGQRVPDGLIAPGMTAAEEQDRLNRKYQNLRVVVALRSAPDLRPLEPEEVVSLTVKQREWEGRDSSTRQAQLVDLFNKTVTGTWGAHVEARGGLTIGVDGKDFDAYWTLLHLNRGFIPPGESLDAVTVVAPIASPTMREEAAAVVDPATVAGSLPPVMLDIGNETATLGEAPSARAANSENDEEQRRQAAADTLLYELGVANHTLRERRRTGEKQRVTVRELADVLDRNPKYLGTRARELGVNLAPFKLLTGPRLFDPLLMAIEKT